MPELRFNLITREWVILHSDRAKPPEEFRQRSDRRYRPPYLKSCPFCPGNESKTPEEIFRHPAEGPWQVRVTLNKFAVLSDRGERRRTNDGLRHRVSGVGRHEVIIESPLHDMTLALLDDGQVADVLRVYRDRFTASFSDRRVHHVIVFKNHGVAAGTTIMHPHSQLIATPVVPIQIRSRVDESMRYFDYTGECLVCATLSDEMRDAARVVVDTRHFVSFVPYAALSPFHLWIFPKSHQQSFSMLTDDELRDLAANLRSTVARLYHGLDDPDFNLAIRSLSPYRSRSEYIHWYITIVPRVTSETGFQLGSGMHVNPAIPDDVAAFLREVRES